MRFAQLVVWILVILSFALVNIDPKLNWDIAFGALKLSIECFLLFFAAYQILKTTETQPNQFEHIVKFRQQSSKFYTLIWMGVVLTLADFVLIEHYRQILSSDTILAAILFLYYSGQILFQNKPKVLLGKGKFIYDDYFPKGWTWNAIQKMVLDDEKIVISDNHEEFKISISGVDDLDPTQIGVELEAEVLDGRVHFIDDASNLHSLLKESAEKHGFTLDLSK